MYISVFEMFTIGIGPSSSHTVGPMRAARYFAQTLLEQHLLPQTAQIRTELFGSLGATGKGHGTDTGIILGLQGERPDVIDPDAIPGILNAIRSKQHIALLGQHTIPFDEKHDLILHQQRSLDQHSNGMTFHAFNNNGQLLFKRSYFSVGGGFIQDEDSIHAPETTSSIAIPYPFHSAAELLALCQMHKKPISQIILENELASQSADQVRQRLLEIWYVMQACVRRGCERTGILPGCMQVKRRAADLYQSLLSIPEASLRDPLTVLDWVNLYALAVNEENANGGRVVTAPTNGAAGIIPAVLHYYNRFVPGANEEGVIRFLLTAAAIGTLFKLNASISGAEVGCQGEVGSACSMAAGALTEVLGGTPKQVENAAEIGMEHNLGLTCDPIGGLVQVPCIERNAMAATKAINAARMALRGDGQHCVSLDEVIKTMRATGKDMNTKYKETARGGLAIHVAKLPVSIVEC